MSGIFVNVCRKGLVLKTINATPIVSKDESLRIVVDNKVHQFPLDKDLFLEDIKGNRYMFSSCLSPSFIEFAIMDMPTFTL